MMLPIPPASRRQIPSFSCTCCAVFALLITLGSVLEAHAQSSFKPGFVLPKSASTEADTLHGEIKHTDWVQTPSSIEFRSAETGEITTYEPDDLAAFSVAGDEYESYRVTLDLRPTELRSGRPRELFDRRKLFMLKLVEGPLTLYSYRNDRKHFFLKTEDGSPKELTYYVQQVNRNGSVYRAESADFRDQLNKARTPACAARPVERVDYDLKDLVEFVSACNGDEGRQLAKNELQRSGFQTDHEVGLRFGRMALTHDFLKDEITTPGIRPSLFYQLHVTKNIQDPNYALLIGLEVSQVSTGDAQSTTFVSARDESLGIIQSRETVQTLSTSAVIGALSLGVRRSFLTGSIRPYIGAGVETSYPLSYSSEGQAVVTVREEQIDGSAPPTSNQSTDEISADPWTTLQIGGRFRAGVDWNQWSFGAQYRVAFERQPSSVPLQLSRDGGVTATDESGFAPSATQILLHVGYRF